MANSPSKAGEPAMSTQRAAQQSQSKPSYPTLAGFYNADERRISSRELDVGLWWREDALGPLHRAAWVSETGELYLVRLGPGEEGGGRVEVLATVDDRERLESALSGWRERCGEPRSLGWLRERSARMEEGPSPGAPGARRVAPGSAARRSPCARSEPLAASRAPTETSERPGNRPGVWQDQAMPRAKRPQEGPDGA